MRDTFGIALGEASTWRGLIALAGVFGANLDPDQTEAIATAAVGLYGLVGVFTRRSRE